MKLIKLLLVLSALSPAYGMMVALQEQEARSKTPASPEGALLTPLTVFYEHADSNFGHLRKEGKPFSDEDIQKSLSSLSPKEWKNLCDKWTACVSKFNDVPSNEVRIAFPDNSDYGPLYANSISWALRLKDAIHSGDGKEEDTCKKGLVETFKSQDVKAFLQQYLNHTSLAEGETQLLAGAVFVGNGWWDSQTRAQQDPNAPTPNIMDNLTPDLTDTAPVLEAKGVPWGATQGDGGEPLENNDPEQTEVVRVDQSSILKKWRGTFPRYYGGRSKTNP